MIGGRPPAAPTLRAFPPQGGKVAFAEQMTDEGADVRGTESPRPSGPPPFDKGGFLQGAATWTRRPPRAPQADSYPPYISRTKRSASHDHRYPHHTFPDKIAAATLDKLKHLSHTTPFSDGTAAGLAASMARAGVDRSVVMPVATQPPARSPT